MSERVIPQRDLRNNVGEILRAAERGDSFTVTVRGRPVARVVPLEQPPGPRVDVDPETLRAIVDEHGPDEEWLRELREMREAEEPIT